MLDSVTAKVLRYNGWSSLLSLRSRRCYKRYKYGHQRCSIIGAGLKATVCAAVGSQHASIHNFWQKPQDMDYCLVPWPWEGR